jgi:choline kinase
MGGVEKACLRVGGISLLERHFRNFAALGVEPERVRVVYSGDATALETERLGGMPVRSSFPGEPGTLGSFMTCFPTDDTLVVHGDLVWEPSLALSALASPGGAVLPLEMGPADPEAMKAEVRDGLIVRLSKNLPPSRCHGESMGVFLFRKKVLSELRACCLRAMADLRGNAALDDAVNLLAEKTDVRWVSHGGGVWEEIDTPRDLERAEAVFSG